MTRATDPQRLTSKCLRVFLLAVLVLWLDKPCTFAVFDLPVGGRWIAKLQLATSGKLGENITPLVCAFSAYMSLCYSATHHQV